jgi:AcrR family transcriptional regulator
VRVPVALEIRRIRHILYSRLLKSPMTDRPNAQISSRKRPKQARSTGLVAAILEAAAQVLAKEGAPRFTTARVAERAGVSVGSIYQYFPNKAAILFRLQSDEWRQTSDLLRAILEDVRRPPLERLRAIVHAFIRSECEEAAMCVALNDAALFTAMRPRRGRQRRREIAQCKSLRGRRSPRSPNRRAAWPPT